MTFRPVARSLTLAAALLAGSIAAASAQTATAPADAKKPPAAQAATSSRPETVDQRIASLKTALKITPDQESKWNDVAKAMHDNAAKMDKLIQEKRASQAKLNAVDDLKTYQEISQAHVDGLKNLISSFKSLYDAMPAEQKANADKVFDSYGPTTTGRQG
jgi:protein CpxP